MKSTLIILVLFACTFILRAQDNIHKRNGEIIQCKIIRISSEEISYSLAEYDFTVEFAIEKSKVDRIVFGNGKELIIDHAEAARESTESNSEDLFLVQNRNAVKLNVWSVMFGTTAIAYERAVKPGQSFECDLGIVGLGVDVAEENPLGVGFKAGYKFFVSPNYFLKRMRYTHILKGPYVKPEITFASYSHGSTEQVTKGAIFITFGNQRVFADRFLIDSFASLGYGFTNAGSFENFPYYFGVIGDGFPLSGTFGFRIGFLL